MSLEGEMAALIIGALLFGHLALASWTSWRLLHGENSMAPLHRNAQLVVAWLVPYLGSALVLHFANETMAMNPRRTTPNEPIHNEAWNEVDVSLGAHDHGIQDGNP